jgi:hypothetical protein
MLHVAHTKHDYPTAKSSKNLSRKSFASCESISRRKRSKIAKKDSGRKRKMSENGVPIRHKTDQNRPRFLASHFFLHPPYHLRWPPHIFIDQEGLSGIIKTPLKVESQRQLSLSQAVVKRKQFLQAVNFSVQ